MQARCSLVKHPDFGLKKCVHKFFSQGSCASQPTKITSAMSPVIQNICVVLPFPYAGMWLKCSSNGKACASHAPKYLCAAICKLFFRDVCRVVLGASNAPHHSDQLPSTVSLTKSYLLECGEYYWSIFDVFIHFLTLIGSIRTVGILFWCVSSDQGLYSRFFVPSDQLVFL